MFCDKICILRKVQLHISNGTTTTKDIIGLVFGLVPNVQTVSRAIVTTGVSINTVQKRVNGIKVGIFLRRWQDNLIDGIMSILYYSNNTGKYGMISELIKINTMRCHDNAVRITSPIMWGILQSPVACPKKASISIIALSVRLFFCLSVCHRSDPLRDSKSIRLICASYLALIRPPPPHHHHHCQVKRSNIEFTRRSYLKCWHLVANGVATISSLDLFFWFHENPRRICYDTLRGYGDVSAFT